MVWVARVWAGATPGDRAGPSPWSWGGLGRGLPARPPPSAASGLPSGSDVARLRAAARAPDPEAGPRKPRASRGRRAGREESRGRSGLVGVGGGDVEEVTPRPGGRQTSGRGARGCNRIPGAAAWGGGCAESGGRGDTQPQPQRLAAPGPAEGSGRAARGWGPAGAAARRREGGWGAGAGAAPRSGSEAGAGAGGRRLPARLQGLGGPGRAPAGPWQPGASPRCPPCPRTAAAAPSRPATSRTPSGSTAKTGASSCASTPTAEWTGSGRRATLTVSAGPLVLPQPVCGSRGSPFPARPACASLRPSGMCGLFPRGPRRCRVHRPPQPPRSCGVGLDAPPPPRLWGLPVSPGPGRRAPFAHTTCRIGDAGLRRSGGRSPGCRPRPHPEGPTPSLWDACSPPDKDRRDRNRIKRLYWKNVFPVSCP